MLLSKKGYDLILEYEVGGGKPYYDKYLISPEWPEGFSGVTFGVGWDAGYNDETQFKKDWWIHLTNEDYAELKEVLGIKGEAASNYIRKLKHIKIPYENAINVFENSTIPRFYNLTLNLFPGFEDLHEDCKSSLVSLVFNRGTSLKGSTRKEMWNITKLTPKKDYKSISQEILNMRRLWDRNSQGGLIKRREAEAKLITDCCE